MAPAAGKAAPVGLANPVVLIGVVSNVCSVVGVVMLNKFLATVDGFNFMLLLSALHFAFTTIGTRVLRAQGFFTYKSADIRKVMPVALGSLGSVAFMNLNLAYNSVGFYQLSKLACIPVTLILEAAWYGKKASLPVRLSLIPILAGVGLATVTDVSINAYGSILATAAVLCTTCSQIFTSRFQQDLGCDALQLLYHTAPLITVGMLLLMPFFDDFTLMREFVLTPGVIVRIGISCVLALAVNITNYLVLGKTDPLTYQVLGHFKTITIIVLGFTLFNAPIIPKNLMGVAVAMGGVIMYTEAKRKGAAPKAPAAESSTNGSGEKGGLVELLASKAADKARRPGDGSHSSSPLHSKLEEGSGHKNGSGDTDPLLSRSSMWKET